MKTDISVVYNDGSKIYILLKGKFCPSTLAQWRFGVWVHIFPSDLLVWNMTLSLVGQISDLSQMFTIMRQCIVSKYCVAMIIIMSTYAGEASRARTHDP